MAKKKTIIYKANDSDGGYCCFFSLQDALDFIKYEVEGFPEDDLK